MATQQITWQDKITVGTNPNPDNEQWKSGDANQVKDVVNNNASELDQVINRINPRFEVKTGNTIVFDVYAEYNAASPLTSGNITINPTNAVAGAYAGVYYNGATEPTISGATGQLESGVFIPNELNIYHFVWNTNGQYVLNIQNVSGQGQLIQLQGAYSDEVSDLVGSNSTPIWGKRLAQGFTLSDWIFDVRTAPTGSAITLDVRKNGVSIFSTKPTIAAGAFVSSGAVLSTTDFNVNDDITVYCELVGTTVPGAGLKGDPIGILK